MTLLFLLTTAEAADGRFEFGFGAGFGDATPALASDGTTHAFAFLPGRHFSVRGGGGVRLNERLELGGLAFVDFPDYAIVYSDRGISKGQSASYQVAPFLRVHQDWEHLGLYAGVAPGAAMYSNFTAGRGAEGRWTDTITFVPALEGQAGVAIQGFGEYSFFLEGASTWQPTKQTEEELAVFQLAATQSPIEAEQLEDPSALKWRATVGVHIHGR